MARTWKEIREKYIKTPEDEARIEAIAQEMLAEVRAYRLAEVQEAERTTGS